jgi:hypothetical protein
VTTPASAEEVTTALTEQPSDWQQRIEGEWFGQPAVFDPQGNHVGYEKVSRASVFQDGRTTYWMKTTLEATGELRARFELADQFEFAVRDGQHRVYLGPDFYGAGEPYGSLVDAHYYSPAWQADLRTMVHVLADGRTQVYSSLLYDGPTICAVFNGVYRVAFDRETNDETRADIDAFVALERDRGPRPQVLPQKRAGTWSGDMEVYGPDQKPIGTNRVVIRHEPIDLLRARHTVEIRGVEDRTYSFERTRNGNLTTFHGPDVWGNARTYGRALYPSQHMTGSALKLKGREFLIDDDLDLSVVWQVSEGESLQYVSYGLLSWEADA